MKAKRPVFKDLCDDLNKPEITIVLGARQVGKTYLLQELENFARSKGKRTAYFNLEIPSDAVKFSGSEEKVFETLTKTADVILLDEFHYLKNASHLFKAVFDSRARVKIFASGSSSLEIHKHLKESLAGRRRVVKVFPLSVGECKENKIVSEQLMVDGSLPGLLNQETEADKQIYLRDLLETYILKDIKALIKDENVKAFNHLLFLLSEHQSTVVSVSSLAKEIGLTARTVEKYLTILEQTYVCYSLPSFSTNVANELKKSRKYYFYDLGIRNAIIKNFEYDLENRKDKGVLLESLVFLELLRKVSPNTGIFFWRTKQKAEVDFVKVVNRKPIPIEVKYRFDSKEIPNGMKAFFDRYPSAQEGYIVTAGEEGKLKYKQASVNIISWQNSDVL
ncbi:MAG: ATP-binding protein [Candidatus Omnitrophica bacterium]|nr:ATP-binding protein [Candidatus Omnitrophota bacterium]